MTKLHRPTLVAVLYVLTGLGGCDKPTTPPATDRTTAGTGSETPPPPTIPVPPIDAAGFHRRGVTRIAEKKYAEALDDLKRAGDLAPAVPIYRNDYAVAFFHAGRLEDALEQLNEAIRLDPKLPVAYANRARVRGKLGRHEEALADADNLVTFDPRFAPSYYVRGIVHYMSGCLPAAEADFSRCLELDPAFVSAHHNRSVVRLGRVQAGEGSLDAALEDLDVLADRLPEQRHVYLLNRGIVLAKADRPAEAEAAFSATIAAYPRYPEAYNNRAAVRFDRNNLDGAYQDLLVADQLAPGKYANNLAVIRRRLTESFGRADLPPFNVPPPSSPEPWRDDDQTRFWVEFGVNLAFYLLQERFAAEDRAPPEELYRRVHVQAYMRSDGTSVREHDRYIPVKQR